MGAIRSGAVATARFTYDFIFGDDWSVALVILLGLIATGWLISNAILAWWLVPVLAIAMTGISLQRARRSRVSRAHLPLDESFARGVVRMVAAAAKDGAAVLRGARDKAIHQRSGQVIHRDQM